MEQSKHMLQLVYQALEDKKGEDIVMIDISQISVLADYFVICSAGSDSQIQALVAQCGRDHAQKRLFYPSTGRT